MKNWKVKIKEIKSKEDLRQLAIYFQQWLSEHNLSYGELNYYTNDLYNLAKKFGLVRELKENGLI